MLIRYKKHFEKEFKNLDAKTKTAFIQRLEIFQRNKFHPFLRNHSVDTAFPNCRSISISGDLRAIFHEDGEIVTFIHISTHAQLYE